MNRSVKRHEVRETRNAPVAHEISVIECLYRFLDCEIPWTLRKMRKGRLKRRGQKHWCDSSATEALNPILIHTCTYPAQLKKRTKKKGAIPSAGSPLSGLAAPSPPGSVFSPPASEAGDRSEYGGDLYVLFSFYQPSNMDGLVRP